MLTSLLSTFHSSATSFQTCFEKSWSGLVKRPFWSSCDAIALAFTGHLSGLDAVLPVRRLIVCQGFRLECVKSIDSTVSIQRSWRFSSKRLLKMLAVASDPHWMLRLCGVRTTLGILRPSMGCSFSDNHGELTAWIHWLACCTMPFKTCPNLCLPIVVESEQLCWKAVNLSQSAFLKLHRLTGLLEVGATSGTGVMSDGRCWDLGNFSSTPRVGDSWTSVLLAKAKSELVPEFQRAEWKLSCSFGLYRRVKLLVDAHSTRQVPSLLDLE